MKKILLLLFISSLISNYLCAQEIENNIKGSGIEQSVTEDEGYIEIELPEYSPWEMVTLEGKLKMKGLPLSPTVKIFMERDSLVTVSLRAPFFGEVGRLDLTPTALTIVNKFNKTYVQEDITGKGIIGGKILSINDIQDLLLGRFFIPGYDINSVDLEELVSIIYEDGQILVLPNSQAEIEGVKYGFAVDEKFNPQYLVVTPMDNNDSDIEVTAVYNRKMSGYDLTFVYSKGGNGYEMGLEFKAPVWSGEAPKPIELGNKYRQVSFKDFMKNLN